MGEITNPEAELAASWEKISQEIAKKKELFLQEILVWAEQYDYSGFSDQFFYKQISSVIGEYQIGEDTHRFDIQSFSFQELEPLWQQLDGRLKERLDTLYAHADETTRQSINSGRWKFSPDGRLVPRVINPAIIGGVHGDETTFPEQVASAQKNNTGEIKVDGHIGYFEPEANPSSLDASKRGNPTDMNRPDDTLDEETLGRKEIIVRSVGDLSKPFLIDFHNYGDSSQDLSPHAILIDYPSVEEDGNKIGGGDERLPSDDMLYKIRLAQEMGLDRVISVPPQALDGAIIEQVRQHNSVADGIIVEVGRGDKNNTSLKIALKFLELSGALNNGRPSASVQVDYLFSDSLSNPKDEALLLQLEAEAEKSKGLEIYKIEAVTNVGENDSLVYQIINNMPCRISKWVFDGKKLHRVPISENEVMKF